MKGKKNGQGVYSETSGDIYDGSWKDDKREGFGVQIYGNGDKY